MPELPHDSSIQKIRSLCQELATQYGLDEQTCDELCGHLEDKLTGYFSGDIKITEEDALLLVRAHFGNASTIAKQLGRPQPAGVSPRLASLRRVIAMSTALLTLIAIGVWMFIRFHSYNPSNDSFSNDHNMVFTVHVGEAIFVALVLAIFELALVVAARMYAAPLAQRLIAAWLLLPNVVALYLLVTFVGRPWGNPDVFAVAFDPMARAMGFASLIGHALLLILILLPAGRPSHDGSTEMAAG